jgi:hypothetical protein
VGEEGMLVPEKVTMWQLALSTEHKPEATWKRGPQLKKTKQQPPPPQKKNQTNQKTDFMRVGMLLRHFLIVNWFRRV